jgi:hypothetical protein
VRSRQKFSKLSPGSQGARGALDYSGSVRRPLARRAQGEKRAAGAETRTAKVEEQADAPSTPSCFPTTSGPTSPQSGVSQVVGKPRIKAKWDQLSPQAILLPVATFHKKIK